MSLAQLTTSNKINSCHSPENSWLWRHASQAWICLFIQISTPKIHDLEGLKKEEKKEKHFLTALRVNENTILNITPNDNSSLIFISQQKDFYSAEGCIYLKINCRHLHFSNITAPSSHQCNCCPDSTSENAVKENSLITHPHLLTSLLCCLSSIVCLRLCPQTKGASHTSSFSP